MTVETAAGPSRTALLAYQSLRAAGRAYDARFYPKNSSVPYDCIVTWRENGINPGNEHGNQFIHEIKITALLEQLPQSAVRDPRTLAGGKFIVIDPVNRSVERRVLVRSIDRYDHVRCTMSVLPEKLDA